MNAQRRKATIVGLMPKRRKFPILVEIDGKQLLLMEDEIQRKLGGKVAA